MFGCSDKLLFSCSTTGGYCVLCTDELILIQSTVVTAACMHALQATLQRPCIDRGTTRARGGTCPLTRGALPHFSCANIFTVNVLALLE